MIPSDVGSPPHGRDEDDLHKPLTRHNQDAETLGESTPKNGSLDRARGPANEQLPLLSPAHSETGNDDLVDLQTMLDEYDEYQVTKRIWYLIILTMSLGGLQVAWSVELSNGSPFLLSLGLSKSLMALVWIAGPLSGTLVQPYVGTKSDNSRLSWGKRKPFMLGGAAATIVAFLCLAWVREIVGGFLGLFGAKQDSNLVHVSIIVVAVLFVYILDFAINTVQAAIRAFMVDCAPTHQQEAANAMASRVTGIGNIIGYCFGYINLKKYMWFFGDTQFKVLCVIASIALGSTVLISTTFIKERDPRLEGPPPKDKGGALAFFKGVFRSMKQLPPQTRKVCEVQFFAWIGWFGFLFYLSTWIGDLYVQPALEANPDMTPEEIDQLYEKAIRVGTFALLIWAISSLLSNLFLPFFVAPTYGTPVVITRPDSASSSSSSSSSASSSTASEYSTTRLDRILSTLIIPWLSLRRAWMISLGLFALSMWSTLFISNPTTATVVVGIVGIPWALTIWAPFAIISAEISRRDAVRRAQAYNREVINPEDDNGDQAGVILGIHNVAIAAPQVIATLGSSLIFKFLQKPRGTPGDRSMPVVLAVGGIFAAIAAFMASRLEDLKEAVVAVEETDRETRHRERDLERDIERRSERRMSIGSFAESFTY